MEDVQNLNKQIDFNKSPCHYKGKSISKTTFYKF